MYNYRLQNAMLRLLQTPKYAWRVRFKFNSARLNPQVTQLYFEKKPTALSTVGNKEYFDVLPEASQTAKSPRKASNMMTLRGAAECYLTSQSPRTALRVGAFSLHWRVLPLIGLFM